MKKKIFRVVAALVLMCILAVSMASCGNTSGSVPDAESASGAVDGASINWNYDEKSKTLTLTGTGAMPNFESSEKVSWYAVRHSVEKISVAAGITSIGDYAFYYSPKLSEISIPASVTAIGKLAFAFCSSLKAVTIPEGLTSVGDSAFEGCIALEGIYVPAAVTSLGERAFAHCSALKTAIIMGHISEIKALTFKGCRAVETLCFNTSAQGITVAENAFEGCSKTFAAAEFTESQSGMATLTVNYVYADGTKAADSYTAELAYGSSYSVVSPEIGGYKANFLTVSGAISKFTTVVDVTYTPIEAETSAETEADTQTVEEEKEKTTVGTVIAIVILVIVIAAIAVLAVFMIRSDKKDQKGTVRNQGSKPKKK